jgi:hypothetical protein
LLGEKREKIIKADAEAQRRARHAAAEAERNDLAQHIRTRYPELAMEMVSLVRRLEASNAECQAVGLKSAEYVARSTGFYWDMDKGGGHITHIAEITLPLLLRAGNYLPVAYDYMTGETKQWDAMVERDLAGAAEPIPEIAPAAAAAQAAAA